MGIFSRKSSTSNSNNLMPKSQQPYLLHRNFTVPCTSFEFLSVLFSGQNSFQNEEIWKNLKESYDRNLETGTGVIQAPLTEAIYLTNWNENGLEVMAGNRANSYWTLLLRLDGSNQVSGSIDFNVPPGTEAVRWYGNVMTLVADIQFAVLSIGGKIGDWPR